jgi:outer membrane lipoprotein-sorting protein
MHTHRRRSLLRGLLLASACAAAALTLPSSPPAEARGGAPAPVADPNAALGAQLFEQCIQWVAQGAGGIARTTDFQIQLMAEMELESTRHRGPMRLFWASPDKYRQELTTRGQTTTKILNGDFMWIVHPDRRVQRMHGTPEGARAVQQLKEDRDRMSDLAQFITLESLKGPGVQFLFAGEKRGSGSFAGDWLKVTRVAPGATTMHFWLAYDRDARGGYMAKWPGIVRIDGDVRQNMPTEDFILSSWAESPPNQPRRFRYPRAIEAYSRSPGQPPIRFLKADVQDIRINTGIPDGWFSPPVAGGR